MKTLILIALISQFPGQPGKTLPQATLPSKSTPLASPQQDAPLASPQTSYAPQADPVQPVVVLRAAVPQVYAVTRQVVVQAAPMVYSQVAYAAVDPGCGVAQQTVIQRNLIQHSAVVSHNVGAGVVHQAQVNHAVVAGGGRAARAPRKIVTKQVTKQRRGLLGGLFGG